MIKTRSEACMVLGVSLGANESEIKSAYKALVKIYHPDSSTVADVNRYNKIIEAYEFLCPKTGSVPLSASNRVVGQGTKKSVGKRYSTSQSEYDAFQKRMEKQKQEKARAFEQKTREYSAMIEKQEEDYKRAMKAIDAIRAARAIEAMVWANGLGKDTKEEES